MVRQPKILGPSTSRPVGLSTRKAKSADQEECWWCARHTPKEWSAHPIRMVGILRKSSRCTWLLMVWSVHTQRVVDARGWPVAYTSLTTLELRKENHLRSRSRTFKPSSLYRTKILIEDVVWETRRWSAADHAYLDKSRPDRRPPFQP